MITEKELNPLFHPLNSQQRLNFLQHYFSVNELRGAYKVPMICTSGVRTREEHALVYLKKNRERKKIGLSDLPIPWGSAHLIGAASDYFDPDMRLYRWCEGNESTLQRLDIYVEYRELNDGQVHTHLQTRIPKSGARFFKPYA